MVKLGTWRAPTPPLREARLLLPPQDNHGRDLSWDLGNVETALVHHFGGFTRIKARGAWNNDGTVSREPMMVYDIAAEDTPANNATLRSIAAAACRMMDQACVYKRGFNGNVELVKPLRPGLFNILA